jgi:lipopolysaccharide transport system permease protein
MPGFVLAGERTSARRLMAELWRSRELVVQLSRREFFVRYRRATFGILWAVALPVAQAVVLAAVIRRFVRFDTGDDYTLFVFAGTLIWAFFAGAIPAATTSVTDNSGMSSKIYFPRAVFPLTVIGSGLYGLAITVGLLLLLTVTIGDGIGPEALLVVPGSLLLVLLTASLGVLLAGLQVYFRDVRYLVQAGIVVLTYATPLFYPLSAVGSLRSYLEANPMTGVVELFRAATVGADPGWVDSLWWTLAWTAVAALGALAFHMRHDRVMSDLL